MAYRFCQLTAVQIICGNCQYLRRYTKAVFKFANANVKLKNVKDYSNKPQFGVLGVLIEI